MGTARHGRRREARAGASRSVDGSGLPSWAQRHLDDDTPLVASAAAPRSRHRPVRREADGNRLRGWGVAAASVAAAVGVVPFAISSVANNRADDPLPRVETFRVVGPGVLSPGTPDAGPGGSDTGPAGGVSVAPDGAPGAAPVPAAVARPTEVTRIRPRATATAPRSTASAAPSPSGRTTTATTPTGDAGADPAPPSSAPDRADTPRSDSGSGSGSGSGGGSSPSSGSPRESSRPGLVGGAVDTVTDAAGGVLGTADGLL